VSHALDAELFKFVADVLVQEACVQPMLHRQFVAPILQEGAIRGAIVESKAGRQAILAARVVDATGDADVAARAGAPTHKTPREEMMSVSVMFSMSGVNKQRFIEAVKARGCQVALDDFGSGLSSFGYLRQLPADMLKIDGVFVRDMDIDPVSRAAVRAITEIGRELHMTVIAEWVESTEVAEQLQVLGVDGLQGYAIERLMALERMTQPALWPGRSALPSEGRPSLP